MTLQEQVAHLRQQVDTLTKQVLVLTSHIGKEPAESSQTNRNGKEIGLDRYRALQGKA